MRIGILGGGLSGITLQSFLEMESEILEKEDRVGGLCRTFEKEGFSYDVGGHILFSKDEKIMKLVRAVLAGNINYCKRDSKIFFKGRFVKYPFENGLGVLDKEDIYECLIGYLQNEHPKPTNFLEWIYYTFGNGLSEKYLVPYNQKIWKYDLKKMSLEWMERIPKPPVEDVVKSALGIETEGYVHQLYFNYPAVGGIEGLVKAFVKKNSKITTGFEIRTIRKDGKEWLVSDGRNNRCYDQLILTIPVKEAVKYFPTVPEEVRRATEALIHNSVRVVLVGVKNETLSDRGAVYVPSPEVVAHRLCYMGYFSRNNVPSGKSSLMAEITTNPLIELHTVADDLLIEKVVEDLHKVGIINKQDVTITDIKNLEYGYVVYDLDYQKNMKIVRDYFQELGIILHGRFAEFEYINMDEVINRSLKLAETLNKFKG